MGGIRRTSGISAFIQAFRAMPGVDYSQPFCRASRYASMRLPDAELADRFGQIVAHRALRQMQLLGDIGRGHAFAGQTQHLPLAIVERIVAGPGLERELRIDRASAAMDLAQRLGELIGRRILQQVAADAGVERAAQNPGRRTWSG
jgi:hypothetical protein